MMRFRIRPTYGAESANRGRSRPGTTLVEMVMAVVLTAMVFASAIIPMTSVMATHQKVEAGADQRAGQLFAAARIDALGGSAWRDAQPPNGLAAWTAVSATSMTIGDWSLRQNKSSIQVRYKNQAWTPAATGVKGLGIEILRSDGTWVKKPKKKQIGAAVAIRVRWTGPPGTTSYGSLVALPDRAHRAAPLELPKASAPKKGYSRSDYESQLTFELGSWP